MADRLTVGIIGAGRIGKMHAANLVYLVPEAKVVAIADVRQEAAEACAAELDIPNAYGDPRWIVDDSNIEAVVICSSTDTHAPLIEQAAEAGKYIFCEKPIALELDVIDRTLATVSRTGAFLQIGFNRRFDPSFSRVRELVAEGKLGVPHTLRITSRDPKPPSLDYVRTSGGMFLDMSIHDFDMARYLIGDEIESVYTAATVRIDPRIKEYGDVDTAVIVLQFRNETLGTIDNSRQAVYGYDQRIEVFGSDGMALVTNKTPDQVIVHNVDGTHSACPLYFFLERYTEAFVAEMKAFIRSVRAGEPPAVSGDDGRIAAVIAYAAKRSHEESRPVKLSEVDPRMQT